MVLLVILHKKSDKQHVKERNYAFIHKPFYFIRYGQTDMKNIFFAFLLYSLFAHGLEIKVITSSQIEQAKTLVVNTAYNVFNLSQSFEDFRQEMINTKQFYDIEHVEQTYLNNGGLFLVLLDGDTVVATGGIRRIDTNTAELKRMWMIEEYRGKGWGKKLQSN